MLDTIKKITSKWFCKGDEDSTLHLPNDETATFNLIIDKIHVGLLHCENGEWTFDYTDEFKEHIDNYDKIIGFPDLEKHYHAPSLWPFFRIRLPGLKQPAIQEILKKEHIDKENELALLKRFGQKTIANPYKLTLKEA